MKKEHLSKALLARLIAGEANEAERLACAEHLSSCDKCLKKYTALLTDEICLTPPEGLALRVRNEVRRRAANGFASRFAAAAAAIILAMGLWMTDAFTFLVPDPNSPALSSPVQEQRVSISDRLNGFFNSLSDSLIELTLTYPDPRADESGADSTIKES